MIPILVALFCSFGLLLMFRTLKARNYARALFGVACVVIGLAVMVSDTKASSPSNARDLYSQLFKPKSEVCPDNGAGTAATCTLIFEAAIVKYTCSDANGCNAVLSESGAEDGRHQTIVNVSANAVTVPDTAGVSEVAGGGVVLGQWDAIDLVYVTDRWVQASASNN